MDCKLSDFFMTYFIQTSIKFKIFIFTQLIQNNFSEKEINTPQKRIQIGKEGRNI